MAESIITKNIFTTPEPVSSVNAPSPVKENEGKKTAEAKQEKVSAYENVVSVSEDGDTVQVDPEAKERLSDGFVFNKEKEDEPSEEEKKLSKVRVSSASDSELERMYLTGRISSFDYNREMESRKEQEESLKEKSGELSDDLTSAEVTSENAKKTAKDVLSEDFGAGYSTKEEKDAAADILLGRGTAEKDSGEEAFEINITR